MDNLQLQVNNEKNILGDTKRLYFKPKLHWNCWRPGLRLQPHSGLQHWPNRTHRSVDLSWVAKSRINCSALLSKTRHFKNHKTSFLPARGVLKSLEAKQRTSASDSARTLRPSSVLPSRLIWLRCWIQTNATEQYDFSSVFCAVV